MILHRITAIFAGINCDFTGPNHADLAARYGIPLPLVFQTLALAHQIKTKSRTQTEPDILEIAATISDITNTVDSPQRLTTAQILRIANLVRTGGVVDIPIPHPRALSEKEMLQRQGIEPCSPHDKGRAERDDGFPAAVSVIGCNCQWPPEDLIQAYIRASRRHCSKFTVTRAQAIAVLRANHNGAANG